MTSRHSSWLPALARRQRPRSVGIIMIVILCHPNRATNCSTTKKRCRSSTYPLVSELDIARVPMCKLRYHSPAAIRSRPSSLASRAVVCVLTFRMRPLVVGGDMTSLYAIMHALSRASTTEERLVLPRLTVSHQGVERFNTPAIPKWRPHLDHNIEVRLQPCNPTIRARKRGGCASDRRLCPRKAVARK